MLFLAEFLPLVLFLVAYSYKGLYAAIVVLMIAMPVGLAFKYARTRQLDRMYFWSTVFLFVFGSAALYFRSPDFLYWKPTAFYWILALAFLLSHFVGDRPLVQRFFGLMGELPIHRISAPQWRTLNFVWIVFLSGVGLLNIFVAYNFSEAFWVNFKVFGLMGITFVFMIAQTLWMVRRFGTSDADDRQT